MGRSDFAIQEVGAAVQDRLCAEVRRAPSFPGWLVRIQPP
jgi:hypothetical protein